MMHKTFCCWVDMGDVDFKDLYAEFQAASAYNISEYGILPTMNIMKDSDYCKGNIQDIRKEIYKHFPFRQNACPYGGMRCCGSCVRVCSNRCVMDAYNKCCSVLLHGLNSQGILDKSRLRLNDIHVKTVYDSLTNPELSYYVLTSTAASIITKETNSKVAKALSVYDSKLIKRENHPFSYDYSPEEQLWVNPKTGKLRRVVDNQGYIQFYDYPRSGLCAYCVPHITVDRSRMTKYQRRGFDNTFIK